MRVTRAHLKTGGTIPLAREPLIIGWIRKELTKYGLENS